jgi:hypothetical protein
MVLVNFQAVLIPLALDACFSALATGGLLQVALFMWLVIYSSIDRGIRNNLELTPFFRLLHVRHAFDRPGTPTITLTVWEYSKLGVVRSEDSISRSARHKTPLFSYYSTGDW